jgi:hypothetical protein
MTRYKRTQNYLKLIDNQWTEYYWNFILNNLDKNLSWTGLSLNPNITMDIIEKYIYLPWVWKNVSSNPNLTFEFLLKYIDKDWDWYIISENMNLDIIEKNLHLSWDWDGISNNKNINIDFILKYQDQDFCWRTLSSHPNITINNIINTKKTLPWRWKYIMLNPNITLEFINKYKNKIDWDNIYNNPLFALNPDIVSNLNNIDKFNTSSPNFNLFYIDNFNLNNINWKYLCGNHLYKNKQLFIERKLLEYMAAYRIQQWYIKISVDINYKYARKKINNNYDKIYLEYYSI